MITGLTAQILHTFRHILSNVKLIAGPKAEGLILAKIKNTMSDRHIVEKSLNSLLEDYCMDILPTIVHSWEQMT